MKFNRNQELVFHRSILRKPIDAVKRALGHPVPERERTLVEALRPVELRTRLPPTTTTPVVTVTPPQFAWQLEPGWGAETTSEELATRIADQARQLVENVTPGRLPPTTLVENVPPGRLPPTTPETLIPRLVLTTPNDSPPHSKGSSASRSQATHSQDGSTDTVLRADAVDVLGPTTSVYIKRGGQRRMLSSLDPLRQGELQSVMDQIRAAEGRLSRLSEPSDQSDGLASTPVKLGGETLTAFVSFNRDGKVTEVDVSDSDFISRFEATDEGGVTLQQGNDAGPGPSTIAPAPLAPLTGITARVDITPRIQRQTGTSDNTPGDTYVYDPDPQRRHGMIAEATAHGELRLAAINSRPELQGTFGTGTDMILGLAQRLNADGYGVREITGSWINQPGVDSQHARFTQARNISQSDTDAAMRTFFGKVARIFGFTDVRVMTTDTGDFHVRFKRPST